MLDVDDRVDFVLKQVYNSGGLLEKKKDMWKPIYNAYQKEYGPVDKKTKSCLRNDLASRASRYGFIKRHSSGWVLTKEGEKRVESLNNGKKVSKPVQQSFDFNNQSSSVVLDSPRYTSIGLFGATYTEQLITYLLMLNTFAVFFILGKSFF